MTSEQGKHIAFVLVTHIKGMFFNPLRPEGLEFKPVGDSGLRFILKPKNHKDACGDWGGLECKTYATYPATKDQSIFVDSYNHRKIMTRVADGIALPFKSKIHDRILLNEDGSFEGYYPRRYLCPPDISKLIENVENDLALKTDRFLKLLRWRQGIDAPGEVVTHRTLYWKTGEGGEHLLAPPDGGPHKQTTHQTMFGIRWGEEYSKDLQELWSLDDLIEPLGHVLLREAAALATESPRSSMLIMATALETAVKIHITQIVPNTGWLMEKMPSPPIHKVLRDYIPEIHQANGNEIEYWGKIKPFINKVEQLFNVRNIVAHTGKIPNKIGKVKVASIREYLELVSDMLYLLDVLDGHDWAKTFACYGLGQALGWPSPKDSRYTVTCIED
jgi:hypothetical protein